MTTHVTSTDENKALARRAIGYINGVGGDAAAIFAPDFVAYMPGQPPMDRLTFERYVAGTAAVFPGYTYEIQDQVAQGDLVVNRFTFRGVHSGEFHGIPPTGRPLEFRGINMYRVKDGRVVSERTELDTFGLLQQIGAIPPA